MKNIDDLVEQWAALKSQKQPWGGDSYTPMLKKVQLLEEILHSGLQQIPGEPFTVREMLDNHRESVRQMREAAED
jgi:hypothetical protein